MNKRYLILILLFLLFFGSFKFDFFQKRVLDFSNFLKIKYQNSLQYLEELIIEHLNQQETIQKLSLQKRELQKYKLKYKSIENELNSLLQQCNLNIMFFQDVKIIRAISYTKLGDFSSMWVDFKDFNQSKIYGLVKDDFAAGIITQKNKKPIALLNNNEKCTYAVEVGDVRAPGIAIGKKNGTMVVKFIPMHKMIKVGDEVVTSGMDKIFFYGIKVGKVIKVKERGSFKVAVVKPYADLSHPKYFWVIY